MNQKQALTLGLYLCVTAPTDDKARQVSAMLDGIAHGMSKQEVERCKRAAMAAIAACAGKTKKTGPPCHFHDREFFKRSR